MVIYVCVKQVPDTETKIIINSNKTGIETSSVKWIMNPYDEYAVEEAIQKKEALKADKIVAVTLGPARAADALRTALAMGADEGLHIVSDDALDTSNVAKALAAAIKAEGQEGFVFTGKLSIDANNSSVSQQVAQFLKIPHTTVISKFDVDGDKVLVERETEAGNKEIVELKTPALVAANKGLNTPRFVSLPGIMKAKKKPIKQVQLSDLGVSAADNKVVFTNYELPQEKPEVKFLSGDNAVQELVSLLRNEAKVI